MTVRRDTRPFNFAALNNAAAAESGADVLAFVNNDVEATEPDWLEPLLAHAQREEVGAVGPLLVRPDGRVQHAGVAIGIHGTAGHPFAGLRPGDGHAVRHGHRRRAQLPGRDRGVPGGRAAQVRRRRGLRRGLRGRRQRCRPGPPPGRGRTPIAVRPPCRARPCGVVHARPVRGAPRRPRAQSRALRRVPRRRRSLLQPESHPRGHVLRHAGAPTNEQALPPHPDHAAPRPDRGGLRLLPRPPAPAQRRR